MEEGKPHVGIHGDLLKHKHVYQLNEIKEMAMEEEERPCDAQLCCHAPLKQIKILCGQLKCLVKLANVSTRCCSHPQDKSEARCKNACVFIDMTPVLVRPCSSMQRPKCWHN